MTTAAFVRSWALSLVGIFFVAVAGYVPLQIFHLPQEAWSVVRWAVTLGSVSTVVHFIGWGLSEV